MKLIKSAIPSTIELRQKIDSNAGTVFANEIQVHQVVMNLCTNAYQAMAEEGGLLEVSLEQKTIGVHEAQSYSQLAPGPYLSLIVSDTGHGIAPENLPRIFEPYFTTQKAGEGTGLGLSTVHSIVKDHGGDIRIYSKQGVGTAFQVLFPLTHAEVAHPAVTIEHLPRGTEQILFIDDEKSLIDTVRHMLESLGYQVEAVSNPLDAPNMFRKDPDKHNLVISDITMPNMTGDKLAAEIKKIRPDIPIILSSGFSSKIDSDRLSQIGISDLLPKPATYSELAMGVRGALDKAAGHIEENSS